MRHFAANVHRLLFARRRFRGLNSFLFRMGLHGLGVLNYGDYGGGEWHFLRSLTRTIENPSVLDIGANVGEYSNRVRDLWPNAAIYSFEPHPEVFERLQSEASDRGYIAINAACSNEVGKTTLYGYKGHPESLKHSSLHSDVIRGIFKAEPRQYTVDLTTVDAFVARNQIQRVHLLKIDTEGHEMRVLEGAQETIANQRIDFIHFEFNEMNVVSRCFFKDFLDGLPEYSFYRMLPNGLLPFGAYNPLMCEIFAYQNIVAIREDLVHTVS